LLHKILWVILKHFLDYRPGGGGGGGAASL
jgi:hypothetical protein